MNRLQKQTKTRDLHRAFFFISAIFAFLIISSLMYFNFLMIQPYLYSFFWALFFTLILGYLKDRILLFISFAKNGISHHPKVGRVAHLLFIFLVTLCFVRSHYIVGIVLVSLYSIKFLDSNVFVSMILVFGTLIIFSFPLFWLVKTCFEESRLATKTIKDFIEHSPEFHAFVSDYENSPWYLAVVNYFHSWGYDIGPQPLDLLKGKITMLTEVLGSHMTTFFGSAVGIASNIGNFFVSFLIFLFVLYYFLVSKDSILLELSLLSPFGDSDNTLLKQAIHRSVFRIFICSCTIGLLHSVVTFLSFSICQLQMKFLFSLLGGFLAIMPIISTWIIWIPVVLIMYFKHNYLLMTIVATNHIFATYFLNPRIYSYIPGANAYFIGISITFGLRTFGINGVIIGPLVFGILLTFKDIYVSYTQQGRGIENKKSMDASQSNLKSLQKQKTNQVMTDAMTNS